MGLRVPMVCRLWWGLGVVFGRMLREMVLEWSADILHFGLDWSEWVRGSNVWEKRYGKQLATPQPIAMSSTMWKSGFEVGVLGCASFDFLGFVLRAHDGDYKMAMFEEDIEDMSCDEADAAGGFFFRMYGRVILGVWVLVCEENVCEENFRHCSG